MKENKLAAESGLRTEIAENFISGLRNLFTESYIEIPEDRVNAFDEMAIAVSSLEERVSAEMKNNVALIQDLLLQYNGDMCGYKNQHIGANAIGISKT